MEPDIPIKTLIGLTIIGLVLIAYETIKHLISKIVLYFKPASN